ncbi:3D (Asp-Asp-Asp) domain-containing protein [Paenibacillus sp. UNC496MF]|uniref:3D domain-containing protein n=1 Tax=Paenibacillus sp. UNC496MF TaxID=1502753 RepID=UPI0008E3047E|nr:3D domain-containing protein [Paenibacillus sp. UNC496MF]SFJ63462.1 3D (Asp-Asp-Asp) domain-containing protein [Paenibacillus sp. UNC496MF]
MNMRRRIASCFGISLLAAVLVIEAKGNYDLSKERNAVHDANLTLKQQIEQHLTDLEQSQSDLGEVQKQKDDLQNENRSLLQEVDKLQDQLKQARTAPPAPTHLLYSGDSMQESQTKWLSFKATYYDLGYASCGKWPGDPGYGITASGRHVKTGLTIAVDPDVIPLGSMVEVMYPDGRVEKRRADDTGGAINGRHIDIYVPKVTSTLGVDKVKVRIISSPSEL